MSREFLLVTAGLLALTIHSIDETLTSGAPSGPPWAGQVAIILVLGTLTALHNRLGRWRALPAALSIALGVFVVGTGWTAHVQPLLERGPRPGDPSGVLFLLGGVLLFASGALLLQRIMVGSRGPVVRPGAAS